MRYGIYVPPIETKIGIHEARWVVYCCSWEDAKDPCFRIGFRYNKAQDLLEKIPASSYRKELRQALKHLEFDFELSCGTRVREIIDMAYSRVYVKPRPKKKHWLLRIFSKTN